MTVTKKMGEKLIIQGTLVANGGGSVSGFPQYTTGNLWQGVDFSCKKEPIIAILHHAKISGFSSVVAQALVFRSLPLCLRYLCTADALLHWPAAGDFSLPAEPGRAGEPATLRSGASRKRALCLRHHRLDTQTEAETFRFSQHGPHRSAAAQHQSHLLPAHLHGAAKKTASSTQGQIFQQRLPQRSPELSHYARQVLHSPAHPPRWQSPDHRYP